MSLQAVTALNDSPAASLPVDELSRLYREMLRLRTLDDRMMTLQRQGRIGFYGACPGQEAACMGAAMTSRQSGSVGQALRLQLMTVRGGWSCRAVQSDDGGRWRD